MRLVWINDEVTDRIQFCATHRPLWHMLAKSILRVANSAERRFSNSLSSFASRFRVSIVPFNLFSRPA